MLVRRYRGKNLREALDNVRDDLGEEATILATRKVRKGLIGRELEVTAALAPVLGAPPAENLRSNATQAKGAAANEKEARAVDAQAQAEKEAAAKAAAEADAQRVAEQQKSSKRSIDARYVARAVAPLRHDMLRLREDLRTLASSFAGHKEQSNRLVSDQMQQVTRQLLRVLGDVSDEEVELLEGPLGALERKLRRAGMGALAARELVANVSELVSAGQAADESVEILAAEQIEQRLRYTFPLETHGRRPAALVGPAGAGKTTTLAKIVARAALLHDKPVAIVGYDTQGIGAAEGVKVLAQTVGIPWRIANSKRVLEREVTSLSREYLVFVDTTGLSPRAAQQLGNLGEALAEAGVESHLVLSADLRDVEMESMVRAFSLLEPRSLTVTKVDQAIGLGGIYDAAMLSGLPLMYLGTGRRVPEDMEEATPQRAASLILGMQYN
jgi:flagellar biosynthesis protein FlhF